MATQCSPINVNAPNRHERSLASVTKHETRADLEAGKRIAKNPTIKYSAYKLNATNLYGNPGSSTEFHTSLVSYFSLKYTCIG